MDTVVYMVSFFALVVMSAMASAIIHEGAHALTAIVMRVPVRRIVVGSGPGIWSKTLGSVRLQLNWPPPVGYVAVESPRDSVHHAGILLAGPIANGVAAAAVVPFIPPQGNLPLGLFFLVNAATCVANLVPWTSRGRGWPSDGRQLVGVWKARHPR